MKERIKKLRKALGLTQQEFADRIGISRGNIATYETRDGTPGSSVIKLICREFNVNEKWLRTGKGEMFVEKNRGAQIHEFIDNALQGKPENFKLRLISALSRLKEDDWEVLERFAADLVDKEEKPVVSASASVRADDMSREELHAELDRQIDDEKEPVEKSQASPESSSSDAMLA